MKTNQKCFECGEGKFERLQTTFVARGQDGDEVAVPHVVLWRCNNCREEVIPPDSGRYIEDWIAKDEDRFSATEVNEFLEAFDVDQTTASHDLGFGLKTFHRWSTGVQQVSRSMGYYLRALRQFPEVYTWIKQRGWRTTPAKRTRSAAGFFITDTGASISDSQRFPSLARSVDTIGTVVGRFRHSNPALGLCRIDEP